MPVSEKEEDGTALALAVVIIKKPSGILLAVPQDYFPADALEDGLLAGPDEMIGPSTIVTVGGGSSGIYGRIATSVRRRFGDRVGACGTCRWTFWITSLYSGIGVSQVPQIFCTCFSTTRSSIP